jgi:formylmethanofuran dehydrogenase subunit E
MHARVTTLSGSPADVDSGIANFQANVLPFAQEEGKGAMLLVDRHSGKAIAITLWEDEQALSASEEAANALRADAATQMGASERPTVERYEVAIFET